MNNNKHAFLSTAPVKKSMLFLRERHLLPSKHAFLSVLRAMTITSLPAYVYIGAVFVAFWVGAIDGSPWWFIGSVAIGLVLMIVGLSYMVDYVIRKSEENNE